MLRWLRPRLTYANVIATLALFLAIGGGAVWAAGKIGTNQIKNGAVTTKKIANKAVTSKKLANKAVTSKKIASPGAYQNVGGPAVPFKNGWSNYPSGNVFPPARFYKDQLGVVHLEGIISGGTAGTTAFTLPSGYRPPSAHAWAVAAGVGSASPEDVDVFANGDVTTVGSVNSAVALDGISFRTH
jgi:hypothetical protein